MENIIFYSLLLVCIGLLFVVGVNFTKINNLKGNVSFWETSFNDVSKRMQELVKENYQIEILKASIKSKDEYIKELEERIVIKHQSISNQANALQKQANEITILKEQVESLTNHLQERAKPFDVMDALDDLIPKKMETKKTKNK